MRRTLILTGCLGLGLSTSAACVVDVGRDARIEHDVKRFDVTAPTDLELYTFDGAVEVRAWDKKEVLVDIEKRSLDRDQIGRVEVLADRTGNRIHIEARHPDSTRRFVIGSATTSARLVANVPVDTNIVVRTGDGNVLVERVKGRLELRTDDGTIRTVETTGELLAETGDGSIDCDEIAGKVEVRTDDGTVRITGVPGIVRARSGDGSMILRIRNGAAMTGDWLVATRDGSVSIELPDGFNAEVETDPGSDGRTRSEFSLVNASEGSRPVRRLNGRLGAGGFVLRLQTGDGTIRLARY